jgi:two-component system OmpR family response regulator
VSPPTTVLIVDDDPDFREFVHIVLESHGYRVLEASNAPAGLALMHEHRPNVVLLDAMMSYELAGIGIIRTVRSDPLPELAQTPLILISAVLAQDEDRFLPADERAMVNRFLTKPISPDELLLEVTAVLQAHSRIPDSVKGSPAPPHQGKELA